MHGAATPTPTHATKPAVAAGLLHMATARHAVNCCSVSAACVPLAIELACGAGVCVTCHSSLGSTWSAGCAWCRTERTMSGRYSRGRLGHARPCWCRGVGRDRCDSCRARPCSRGLVADVMLPRSPGFGGVLGCIRTCIRTCACAYRPVRVGHNGVRSVRWCRRCCRGCRGGAPLGPG